jgi:hypothetical protein
MFVERKFDRWRDLALDVLAPTSATWLLVLASKMILSARLARLYYTTSADCGFLMPLVGLTRRGMSFEQVAALAIRWKTAIEMLSLINIHSREAFGAAGAYVRFLTRV